MGHKKLLILLELTYVELARVLNLSQELSQHNVEVVVELDFKQ